MRRSHAPRRFAVLAIAVAAAPALGHAAETAPIPWLPTRPSVTVEPQLAASCRAHDLRARLDVQGATGSLIGSVVVANSGTRPCSLGGRPSARFAGGPAAATALQLVASAADPPDSSLIYDRDSSLRALAPGRSALVPIAWSNWCPPGVVVTSRGERPSSFVLMLPRGDEVAAPVSVVPRCDNPDRPSTLAIKPFRRRGRTPPAASHLPLRAAIVGAKLSKGLPTLRARRGRLLRYEVALTNISPRAFRFRSCPTYVEDLVPQPHEVYVLNCRPVGPLRPHETVTFAMVMRVAKSAPIGRTGLLWLVGPKTDLPPTAPGRVLITR